MSENIDKIENKLAVDAKSEDKKKEHTTIEAVKPAKEKKENTAIKAVKPVANTDKNETTKQSVSLKSSIPPKKQAAAKKAVKPTKLNTNHNVLKIYGGPNESKMIQSHYIGAVTPTGEEKSGFIKVVYGVKGIGTKTGWIKKR